MAGAAGEGLLFRVFCVYFTFDYEQPGINMKAERIANIDNDFAELAKSSSENSGKSAVPVEVTQRSATLADLRTIVQALPRLDESDAACMAGGSAGIVTPRFAG